MPEGHAAGGLQNQSGNSGRAGLPGRPHTDQSAGSGETSSRWSDAGHGTRPLPTPLQGTQTEAVRREPWRRPKPVGSIDVTESAWNQWRKGRRGNTAMWPGFSRGPTTPSALGRAGVVDHGELPAPVDQGVWCRFRRAVAVAMSTKRFDGQRRARTDSYSSRCRNGRHAATRRRSGKRADVRRCL
jgi:hypothetical protein